MEKISVNDTVKEVKKLTMREEIEHDGTIKEEILLFENNSDRVSTNRFRSCGGE
jgi:hypothetical protein